MTLIPELRAALRDAAGQTPRTRGWRNRWRLRGIAASPAHPRRRAGILSGASLACAAAVAGVVLLLTAGPGTQPAYAVTRNADGTYTIVLRQLTTGIPGLNARFRQLGIAETVIPIRVGCRLRPGSGTSVMHPNPLYEFNGAITQTFSAAYQKRHPALPGWHYVLAAKALPNGKLLALIGQLKKPIPACLPYSPVPSRQLP